MKVFKRKSKESRAARAASSAAAASAALSALSAAAATLVFGGLAVGVLVGAPRLQARIAEESLAAPVHVRFDWPASAKDPSTTWLPPEVQHDLTASALQQLQKSPDPFSSDGLRRIAETAAGTGWFDEITAVRREPGNTVRITGAWRIPAAVIRREGKDFLVSRKGEVLPLAFEEGSSTLKAIVGAQLDPLKVGGQVVQGTVWPGADVRAGLDLLAVIAPRPWSQQVAAIDVGDYLTKKQLVLVTQSRGRIVWGAGVNEPIPGQVSTEAKLKRIDYIQSAFRSIDAGHRIVEVAGPKVLVDETATASAQ